MVDRFSVHFTSPNCSSLIADYLYDILYPVSIIKRPLVLLCIGTDRSTGDSLGPLIGDRLSKALGPMVHVYGTLKAPVHAKNLVDTIKDIKNTYNNPFVISMDACLGSYKAIGNINIENKPLQPGAALSKDLPAIGNLSITGTVNIAGALPFFILQNTRLYEVMMLVDTISSGILQAFDKLHGLSLAENSKLL